MIALTQVLVGTSDLGSCARVFEVVCGVDSKEGNGATRTLEFTGAAIVLREGTLPGISGLVFGGLELSTRADRLSRRRVPFDRDDGGITLAAQEASGIAVRLASRSRAAATTGTGFLDHVAIGVADLEAASSLWEAILGVEAHQMGVHPASGGAFTAARLALGDRMIELVSPVPGVSSNLSKRIADRGDGVAGLAIPVEDVGLVKARLEAMNVRVLRRDPHWFVHPNDCSGVLVQLTPRVEH